MARSYHIPFARFTATCLGITAFATAGLLNPGQPSAQEEVTAMSGGATGSWFRALTAMSECLRQEGDIQMTVVPTAGGMEQFVRMSEGDADVGMNYQSVSVPAWNSAGMFEGDPERRSFRAIGVVEEAAPAHFVVLEESEIEDLSDIAGTDFAPGPVGTVTYYVNMSFLEEAGLLEEVEISNVSHSEMVSYLRDGRIDGWALLGGLPNPATTEQASVVPIRILDIGDEIEDSGFVKNNPFFVRSTIPAGTYPGVDYDVQTFAQNGVLFAHEDTPEDVVYNLTKVLWSDSCLDYLGNAHRALERMKGDPLEGLAFPLHPGAARYWEEQGLDVSRVPTPDEM